MDKKPTHYKKIYCLGLSRITLFELYDLFHKNEEKGNSDDFEEKLLKIFGKKKVTFHDAERLSVAASAFEFGNIGITLKTRIAYFKTLPKYMKEYIHEKLPKKPGLLFGFYKDEKGRIYKRESEEMFSIFIPLGIRQTLDQDFLYGNLGDKVKLTHIHDKKEKFEFTISDISHEKKVTALIFYKP